MENGLKLALQKGKKQKEGIAFRLSPLLRCVGCLSRMRPSLPPIDHCLATGIDDAAFAKVFHGFVQLIAIGKVIVENPLFNIDPIFSLNPYDFHGNHPPSIVDFRLRIVDCRLLHITYFKSFSSKNLNSKMRNTLCYSNPKPLDMFTGKAIEL